MIFKFDGKPPILEDLPDDFLFPNIGKASDVRSQISAELRNVDWADKNWGIYEGNGFSIEFAIGSNEFVAQMTLFVRGNGDAISTIVRLCNAHQWDAYDISACDYIDLKNPSNASWTEFQEYRDQIIGMYEDKKTEQ
jgi:hypothetical protein